ncbi:MAG: glycosyltransferase family 2 protein [Pirellulaceae bacterium]
MKWIAALPVYNEEQYVDGVLAEVSKYAENILVINDGSSDATGARLMDWPKVRVVSHSTNLGYGAALKSAFRYAIDHGFDCLVTLDCDGQHQPKRIPEFVDACQRADIVSGSRYLKKYAGDSEPPSQRMHINRQITEQLNDLLCLNLTDAFCGFKAYRVDALKLLDIEDEGYAMPLELWVQAAMQGLRIVEVPVPLIYLDLSRSFGGSLDEAERRLQYYNDCIDKSVHAMKDRGFELPTQPPASAKVS